MKTPPLIVGVYMVALSLQWFSLHLNCPVASPTWISPHGKGKGELQSSVRQWHGCPWIPSRRSSGMADELMKQLISPSWYLQVPKVPNAVCGRKRFSVLMSQKNFRLKVGCWESEAKLFGNKMQELTSKNTSNRRCNSTGFRLHMAVAEIRSGEWISS